jgi:hypothetical protein
MRETMLFIVTYGIREVVNLEVKSTPFITENKERMSIYEERITKKNWKSTWSNL